MKKFKKKFLCIATTFCVILSMMAIAGSTVSATQAGGIAIGKVYRFKNKGSGKYLNLSGGADVNGRNINQFSDDGTDTLKYYILAGTLTDTYCIRPILCSSRVVDVQRYGEPIISGRNVQIWDNNDPASQNFVFRDTGDGDKSVFICPESNQDVYLSTYDSSNGTYNGKTETSSGNVFVKSYTGQNYQKWYIEETQSNPTNLPAGTYYIRSVFSNKYLSVNDGNVVQQNFSAAATQQWEISYNSSGYYSLKPKSNTAQRLDVDYAYDHNGANVSVYTANGQNNQLFRIIPSGSSESMGYGDPYYRISPKHSTMRVLDVRGPSTDHNTNIQLWTYSENNTQQKWIFERIATPQNAATNQINPTSMVNNNYNRNNAANYASIYGNTPNPWYCDLTNNGGDCTNFASQCLYAGGISMGNSPTSLMQALDGRQSDVLSWYYNADYIDPIGTLGYKGISHTWSLARTFNARFGSGNLLYGTSYQYIKGNL